MVPVTAFDYGYIFNKKNQDTWQSIAKHKYKNIFFDPGNCGYYITHKF